MILRSRRRCVALEWSAFCLAHPDTPGKLAAFSYAVEHLEIGGYEQLRRVAQQAGDTATVQTAERNLTEERTAAQRLADNFDAAVHAALAEQGVD